MIILIFYNQSIGYNFMMDGLYLCVYIVLDFCWNKIFNYIMFIGNYEKIIFFCKIK